MLGLILTALALTIFFDNPSGHQTYTEINSYTQQFRDQFFVHHSYWLPPIEGRMIIFPSHLQHGDQYLLM